MSSSPRPATPIWEGLRNHIEVCAQRPRLPAGPVSVAQPAHIEVCGSAGAVAERGGDDGVMSLSRLSAGAGYRYLTRHTAVGDARPGPGQALTEYYTATGLPPGRWTGAGLPGLGAGDGTDLSAGTVVTEEGMARLFGAGHDPVTGDRLGLAYPKFRTAAARTAERVARLRTDLTEQERATAVAEIETQETVRPTRSAVAGYDLTFTVPKSVSVLWAIGHDELQRAVEQAHHDSVDAVLRLVEDRFLHTRIGDGSKIRVPARGAVAAAFDHWDTRAGDPNLHTHLVIANKVQGPDGGWRAVDGQVLFAAAVACSEIYDSTLADLLAARLPVSFGYRDRGPRRTAAYEIEGIGDPLLHVFSARSQAIGTHLQELVAAFTDTHGREPTRVEVLRLRQQATLATRPDKHLTPLAQLRNRWRATAETLTGRPADTVARTAVTSTNTRVSSIATTDAATEAATAPATGPAAGPAARCAVDVSDALLARYADATVAAVSTRRATWTQVNLLAEAARTTRALRLPDPGARIALLDRVVAAALDRCIALDPPENSAKEARYRHPDPFGASAEAPEPSYSTWAILAAETRLLTAHADTTAPAADAGPIHAAVAARPMPGSPKLSLEQATAAAAILASRRRLDVLVGPAGSGKTRTLCALRGAWENEYGHGSVIGLAPSATAAAQLAASLRIGADTLAKWIHESDPANASGEPWRLRAGQLVIVDEAAMAPTAHLDRLVAHATAAGAKVVLVGDHCQLGAIDAGGAFALLNGEGHAVELGQLHRFTENWEAAATRALRIGDPAVLDTYAAHGRLHDGPQEAMTERAYRAWATDIAAGRQSLLLAADRATVTALNRRARADRLRGGLIDPSAEVMLHDGTAAAAGDHVVTRRNERRLGRPDGGHVRNGDRWHVSTVHADGSLDALPLGSAELQPTPGTAVRLPAEYVRDHVELGYASTVHRAQGATADTAHVIAGAVMPREAFYVAMTRGRDANHAYLVTDDARLDLHHPDPAAAMTGRQVAAGILAREAAPVSASATLRRRHAEQTSPPGPSPAWSASPRAPIWTAPAPPHRHEAPGR